MKQHTITISFTDPLDEDINEELIKEIIEKLEELGLENVEVR